MNRRKAVNIYWNGEWDRERTCFVSVGVAHLWLIVRTKRLIIPSVESVCWEVLEIVISYLEIGSKVILERFHTLQ